MTIYHPLLRSIVWASVVHVLPTGAQEPGDGPVATAPAAESEAESTLTVDAVSARLAAKWRAEIRTKIRELDSNER